MFMHNHSSFFKQKLNSNGGIGMRSVESLNAKPGEEFVSFLCGFSCFLAVWNDLINGN